MNNKGQISSLTPIILTVVLIGILTGVGMMILMQMQAGSYKSTTAGVTNETLTTVSPTGEYLSKYTLTDVACSGLSVTNATDGVFIGSVGNYTVNNCRVLAVTTSAFNNTNWNVTYAYTYNADTATSTAVSNVNNSIGTLASTWIPIIIIVIAAGLIIAILIGSFGVKRV